LEKVQKSAEKSADELPEKWQGFDHINGGKMAYFGFLSALQGCI